VPERKGAWSGPPRSASLKLREATQIEWVLLRKPGDADPGQWPAPQLFPDAAEAISGNGGVTREVTLRVVEITIDIELVRKAE
jgi:hypothetical protein